MSRISVFTFGWPSKENRTGGIFNFRTIDFLKKKGFEFEIIHFRALIPGRKMIVNEIYDGIAITRIAVPVIPNKNFNSILIKLNYHILRIWSKYYCSKVIKRNNKIYTIGLFPLGKIVDSWNKKNKRHLSQAIGSDVNIFLKNAFKGDLKFKVNTIFQFNSKALRNEAIRINPALNKTFHFVNYRGVDLDLFYPGQSKKKDELVFLYLGGMQTFDTQRWYEGNIKGGAFLLKAWEQISNTNKNVKLFFGGPGSDFHEMKNIVKTIKNIELIGSIKPNEVPDLLRSVHVTIIPSLNEGLPNLANESQACGVPILGTNVGGIPETVINEQTGYIIEPSSAKEIAKGIQKFIDNSDNLNVMAENAVNHIKNNFTWNNYFEKFYKAINDIA